MKISVKPFRENLKSISNVVSDFIYIDVSGSDYAFYVSTDTQAMKIPLDVTDLKDEEKQIYVINKIEFSHLISYVTEEFELLSDYSYSANNGTMKGRFEKNEGYAEELESRKMLFDHEDEYENFIEVTPTIMEHIITGSIFVEPDDITMGNRFLDIKDKKVFSFSKNRIYLNDIEIEGDGFLSSEVIKSIQSLGVGAMVKSNNDSYLITNAQRSIFEYFSTPNDVDYHPVLSEEFQKKINKVKSFNKLIFNLEELKSKIEYILFYASKNPNNMVRIKMVDDKVYLATSEDTSVELPNTNIVKVEEFEEMNVPLDCSTLQMIVSKVGKESEDMNMFVSSEQNNKLVVITFGDSEETVIIAKINV